MGALDRTDVSRKRAHRRVTNARRYLTAGPRADHEPARDGQSGKSRGIRIVVPILHSELAPRRDGRSERLLVSGSKHCRAHRHDRARADQIRVAKNRRLTRSFIVRHRRSKGILEIVVAWRNESVERVAGEQSVLFGPLIIHSPNIDSLVASNSRTKPE